ncbi:MAG: type II 3-dehydroquinate dehydratase [Synergistaceae bacterium]|nr:type II 3-dehydroquinate dehydratase [Synergistaceae bacterium]
MKIIVINGPNLNMLGVREPEIYGSQSLQDLNEYIRSFSVSKNIEVDFFQSNHEGNIIDVIQESMGKYEAIIINPAAYTHTSIAIADAIRAVGLPTVEVHLSDVNSREEYRKTSYISEHCVATVSGKGFNSYIDAIEIILSKLK